MAGLIGFLLLPASVHAEIVVAESMEWVLATSDRVVVAKVVKVDTVLDQEKKECQLVTVAITKTLKGENADRVTFLLRPYIHHGYAKQWMDEGIPIIFYLIKNDGKRVAVPAEKCAWLLRDNGNGPDAVLLGKSKHHFTGCIPVLTRQFEVLTETAAILKFVEKSAKLQAKGTPQPHTLEVPSDTAVYKKLWSRSAVYLIVPIDEKLEELGRKWCMTDSPRERTEGAKILRHFKNERNIELLKPLLKDPSTSEATMHRTVPGKAELELVYRKKLYYVRQAAYDALRELGAKVERPVLEELLEGRDDPAPNLDNKRKR
jgi:signal peptidase I